MNKHKTPPWYVVTGGPSSGKTTLINELQKMGYKTVPEVARQLIDQYQAQGITAEDLRKDEPRFQQEMLRTKIEIEKTLPRNEIIFFDRGIPDSIAYYELYHLDATSVKKIARGRYKKIFFLEQLPFKKDYARTENTEEVKKIDKLLLKAYRENGYDTIFIPKETVANRLKLILANIGET